MFLKTYNILFTWVLHSKKCQVMSTKNLSKEAEFRLMSFFNNTIAPDQMAKALRQVNFSYLHFTKNDFILIGLENRNFNMNGNYL